MKPTLRQYLELHWIVFIAGFTAILGLLIQLSTLWLVIWRTGLAALGIAAVIAWQRRAGIEAYVARTPTPTSVVPLLTTGVLVGLHWLLFFGSARVATASVCLAGLSTTSLWTSLLEPLLIGRRVRPVEVGLGLVAVAGLYLIFRFEFDHALGLVMALGSAALAAWFSIRNAQFTRRYPPLVVTGWEMVGACLTTVLFLPVYTTWIAPGESQTAWPQGWDWLWLSSLVGVCTVYGHAAAVRLLRSFSAFTVNLTLNLEPVYGIVLAYLIFAERERMTPGFYLGTLVILSAVLVYPLVNRRSAQARTSSTGDEVVEKIG